MSHLIIQLCDFPKIIIAEKICVIFGAECIWYLLRIRYMCRGQKVFFPNSDVNTNLLGLIESTFVIERSVINMKVNDHMFLLKLKERSFGVIGDTKVINGSNGISSSETILIASRIFL